MKRIKNLEIKSSNQLYQKLFFVYTMVIVGIVMALMVYFIYSIRNRYLEQNLDYLKIIQEESTSYMQNCEDVADYLHRELYQSAMEMNDLIHYLTDEPEDYQGYRLNKYADNQLSIYKGIDDFAATAFETYGFIERITLVSYIRGDMTFFTEGSHVYYNQDGSAVLERVRNRNLADWGEFSFLKEIHDSESLQSVGAMIITFDTEKFAKSWEHYPITELFVYNKNRTVIYDSAGNMNSREIEKARNDGCLERELDAYVQTSEIEPYHIVAYLDKKKSMEVPVSRYLMIFTVGMAVLFMGEILARYYLKHLSTRLDQILNGMMKVMDGDLNVRLPADKNGDELDVISQHFNEMCEKLDLHIKKSYLAEIEQKNAEMAALQSQINPHFLYNTLEAIRMKAICNGDREVGKMLYSMAVTFRSQIKEADVITMAQELHYCKKYLELFEYRYPKKFQSNVECPIEYMNVPIIKFVLQPIIENYFIHGIRMDKEDNFIHIMVEKCEEDYEILVEDNGRGMTHEDIVEKNEQLCEGKMDKTKSIGISNVNRRLKAVYGDAYGIRVEERPEGGLKVILRFRPGEEKAENEESNDCRR